MDIRTLVKTTASIAGLPVYAKACVAFITHRAAVAGQKAQRAAITSNAAHGFDRAGRLKPGLHCALKTLAKPLAKPLARQNPMMIFLVTPASVIMLPRSPARVHSAIL